MTLYKQFGLTAVLAATIISQPARAEGEDVQQAYFQACSEAGLAADAYCLNEVKGKDGKVKLELKQKSMVSAYDENGEWRETGELKDSKANRKDIYSAFTQNGGVDIFKGLKSCEDKSVPPGMVCVSDYSFKRDANGKKLKKEDKVPSKIGVVTDRDEEGNNKYKNFKKDELLKYLTTPAPGGAGIRFTTNKKDLETKINLTADMFKVKSDEIPTPPVVEEQKEVVQQAPKDIDCQTSAIQHLNFPYDSKRDDEVKRFLKLQGELTDARIHYALLNGTKGNDKAKQDLETRIIKLMKDKNSLAYKRLNDAFEKAPLTNRTNQLLKDKRFEHLLNQSNLNKTKPQAAIGVSDLKFLTWATEANDNNGSLIFADDVEKFLKGDSKGVKVADIAKGEKNANSTLEQTASNMITAKIGCQETAKCDALVPKVVKASTAKDMQKIVNAIGDQTVVKQVANLRKSDDTKVIKTDAPQVKKETLVENTDVKKAANTTKSTATNTSTKNTNTSTTTSTSNRSLAGVSASAASSSSLADQMMNKGVTKAKVGDFCVAEDYRCTDAEYAAEVAVDKWGVCQRSDYNPDGKGERQVNHVFKMYGPNNSEHVFAFLLHNKKDMKGDLDDYIADHCMNYNNIEATSNLKINGMVAPKNVSKKFNRTGEELKALSTQNMNAALTSANGTTYFSFGGCQIELRKNQSSGKIGLSAVGTLSAPILSFDEAKASDFGRIAEGCNRTKEKPIKFAEPIETVKAIGRTNGQGIYPFVMYGNCAITSTKPSATVRGITVTVNGKEIFSSTLDYGAACSKTADCKPTIEMRKLGAYFENACR